MFHPLEGDSNELPSSAADGMHDPVSVSRPVHSTVDPKCESENGFPVE